MINTNNKIKLVILDDNYYFAKSVETYLQLFPEFVIDSIFTSSVDFIQALPNINASLFLIDIELPIINGFDVAYQISKQNTNAHLVSITAYEDLVYMEKLISVGFKACILKNRVVEDLMIAINNVLNNKYYFPKEINFNELINNKPKTVES